MSRTVAAVVCGLVISSLIWYKRQAKSILQGTVKGGRRQGRQKKGWEDNIREWGRPGVRQVPEGSGEGRKMEKNGCEVICGAPATLAVKG